MNAKASGRVYSTLNRSFFSCTAVCEATSSLSFLFLLKNGLLAETCWRAVGACFDASSRSDSSKIRASLSFVVSFMTVYFRWAPNLKPGLIEARLEGSCKASCSFTKVGGISNWFRKAPKNCCMHYATVASEVAS
jgi:hypothetical protein